MIDIVAGWIADHIGIDQRIQFKLLLSLLILGGHPQMLSRNDTIQLAYPTQRIVMPLPRPKAGTDTAGVDNT